MIVPVEVSRREYVYQKPKYVLDLLLILPKLIHAYN